MSTDSGALARVGIIGVGQMGAALARRLLGLGHAVTVYDTAAARVEPLVAAGASAAASPRTLADGVDVILSSLPSDAALRHVTLGPEGIAPALGGDRLFADLSTVSRAVSAEVAAGLGDRAASYLRTPVSGSTALAEAGTLTLFASGDADAFARAKPLLAAISRSQAYVGPGEEARVVKLVINAMVCSYAALLGEAVTLGRRAGLDWNVMIDALASSVVASPLLSYKADMLRRRDWRPAATIDLVVKDLSLVLGLGSESHTPTPLAAIAYQAYAARQAQGGGGEDFFAVLKVFEGLAGDDPDAPQVPLA